MASVRRMPSGTGVRPHAAETARWPRPAASSDVSPARRACSTARSAAASLAAMWRRARCASASSRQVLASPASSPSPSKTGTSRSTSPMVSASHPSPSAWYRSQNRPSSAWASPRRSPVARARSLACERIRAASASLPLSVSALARLGSSARRLGSVSGSSAAARPSRLVAAGTSTRAKARLPAPRRVRDRPFGPDGNLGWLDEPHRRAEKELAMSSLPIGEYGLLSDCRSAALVSREGSVDWLCFPRFDAPAVFARLLDQDAGHFSIRPAGKFQASRAYLDQTMALQTTYTTSTGTAVLTDAMAVGRNDRGHDLGAGSPGVLVRRITCTQGTLEVEVSYAPRPEYGLIHPILEAVPGALAARGGADRLLLSAPIDFRVDGATASARLRLEPGETVGGERNWDYRYTWVRDACLTMEALWVAACPDEANRFFGFLADAAASQLQRGLDLQIMFGIGGERDLSERELPHLRGWRDSRPVRVGNGAWNQRQLDVYGELLGAAQRLVQQLGELDPVTQQFLAAAADTAASRWKEKDQGIWEIRGEPRDFLYSKLMCWAALNRAITLAPQLGAAHRVEEWARARGEIRAAILEHGWSEKAGAFTQAFGGEDLDASNLMLAITGFLPGDDPRMKATIDATAERLTDERGLVYRYLAQDGLGGEEGTFLLCTFWLAQAQALAGEVDQAVATFERAVAAINDVGLLAEEIDTDGEMIGNFPQAFSHIGLVNAAWAIAQAQQRAAVAAPTGPEPEPRG